MLTNHMIIKGVNASINSGRMRKLRATLALLCCLLISASSSEVKVYTRGKSRRMKEKTSSLDDNLSVSVSSVSGRSEEIPSCQLATWEDHLVVAARYDEDVSWMASDLTPWMPFLVFSIHGDRNGTHSTESNTGREAQAYLQFIVTYYDCLPKYVVFVHAHQYSPHSQDIVSDLKRLRWDFIPGFLSMSRPTQIHSFSFSDPESHKPNPKDDSNTAHWSQFAYDQLVNLASTWPQLFQEELGEPPEKLFTPSAGQFVVTRERILAHSHSFYEGLLGWLQRASMDSFWAGLVFEQTWSVIFGVGPEYQHPKECDMFLCDEEGAPMVPDWRTTMHLKNRSIRTSLRHQA